MRPQQEEERTRQDEEEEEEPVQEEEMQAGTQDDEPLPELPAGVQEEALRLAGVQDCNRGGEMLVQDERDGEEEVLQGGLRPEEGQER